MSMKKLMKRQRIGVLKGGRPTDKLKHLIWRRFKSQKARCNNPKNPKYKTYGALGIRVEYSFLELWGWVKKQENLYYSLNEPVIGRKDHSKNYSLNNIILQEKSENSKEVCQRLGSPSKYTILTIIILQYGKQIFKGPILKAASHFGFCLETFRRGLRREDGRMFNRGPGSDTYKNMYQVFLSND